MKRRITLLILTFVALMGIALALQNFNFQNSQHNNISPTTNAVYKPVVLDDNRFLEKCSQLMPNYSINLSCPKEEKPLWMEEAQIVAENHVYEKQIYDCDDYSRELVKRLQSDGYESYYCQGTYSNGINTVEHAWVKVVVYVEATSGKVINPVEYQGYSERFCE
jgi:hypothetical protein